jgi:hypothetical protein
MKKREQHETRTREIGRENMTDLKEPGCRTAVMADLS